MDYQEHLTMYRIMRDKKKINYIIHIFFQMQPQQIQKRFAGKNVYTIEEVEKRVMITLQLFDKIDPEKVNICNYLTKYCIILLC